VKGGFKEKKNFGRRLATRKRRVREGGTDDLEKSAENVKEKEGKH